MWSLVLLMKWCCLQGCGGNQGKPGAKYANKMVELEDLILLACIHTCVALISTFKCDQLPIGFFFPFWEKPFCVRWAYQTCHTSKWQFVALVTWAGSLIRVTWVGSLIRVIELHFVGVRAHIYSYSELTYTVLVGSILGICQISSYLCPVKAVLQSYSVWLESEQLS